MLIMFPSLGTLGLQGPPGTCLEIKQLTLHLCYESCRVACLQFFALTAFLSLLGLPGNPGQPGAKGTITDNCSSRELACCASVLLVFNVKLCS